MAQHPRAVWVSQAHALRRTSSHCTYAVKAVTALQQGVNTLLSVKRRNIMVSAQGKRAATKAAPTANNANSTLKRRLRHGLDSVLQQRQHSMKAKIGCRRGGCNSCCRQRVGGFRIGLDLCVCVCVCVQKVARQTRCNDVGQGARRSWDVIPCVSLQPTLAQRQQQEMRL